MLSTELHPLFYSAEELKAMDMQVPCALFRFHAVPLTIDFFAQYADLRISSSSTPKTAGITCSIVEV